MIWNGSIWGGGVVRRGDSGGGGELWKGFDILRMTLIAVRVCNFEYKVVGGH